MKFLALIALVAAIQGTEDNTPDIDAAQLIEEAQPEDLEAAMLGQSPEDQDDNMIEDQLAELEGEEPAEENEAEEQPEENEEEEEWIIPHKTVVAHFW